MKSKTPLTKSKKSAPSATPYFNFDTVPLAGDPGPTGAAPARSARSASLRLIAYIDGGSRGNPGVAGYGAHILNGEKQPVKDLYGFLGVRTNNYAEYSALLAALRYAVHSHCSDLQIFSDSELLVRQLKGVYKVKHPAIRVLFDQAQRYIRQIPHFSATHVYREQNKEADRLANLAMDTRASSDENL